MQQLLGSPAHNLGVSILQDEKIVDGFKAAILQELHVDKFALLWSFSRGCVLFERYSSAGRF
jgi:hypothetical protein